MLDIYTSQWFGNGVGGDRRQRSSVAQPSAVTFLKAHEAEDFLQAETLGAEQGAFERLPKKLRAIAERSVAASRESWFFHWELEFPEVFFGPRPGTERVIEEKQNPGFDAVVGNPPYDVLASEEIGVDLSSAISFFKAQDVFAPAIRGKNNLYKLFICRSFGLCRDGGTLGMITPMAILGDDQAAGVRQLLLRAGQFLAIEAFPQKDDARRRVFTEAKLATSVFVVARRQENQPLVVTTHPGRRLDEVLAELRLRADELIRFDPSNFSILTCAQADWDLAIRILAIPGVKRLGECCETFQGEVNQTTDSRRNLVSTDSNAGPRVVRGANICLYAVREASQGEDIFLRQKEFLRAKMGSEKAHHHLQRRVGWQESSPQNNFRRVIAAPIPAGHFCNHKINYLTEGDSDVDLDLLLAILNSAVTDWFFRLSSTNAAVSHYQIKLLPIPPLDAIEPVQGLSRQIQSLESERIVKRRAERSHLGKEAQVLQDEIDDIIFSTLGLNKSEVHYIKGRLKEML